MIPETAKHLTKKESWAVQRAWLDAFTEPLKANTGKSVFGGFMWHVFSFGFQSHFSREEARQHYADQRAESYYLFNEDMSSCVIVNDEHFPTTLPYGEDWYVMPASQAWTYVSTHESWVYFSYASGEIVPDRQ